MFLHWHRVDRTQLKGSIIYRIISTIVQTASFLTQQLLKFFTFCEAAYSYLIYAPTEDVTCAENCLFLSHEGVTTVI